MVPPITTLKLEKRRALEVLTTPLPRRKGTKTPTGRGKTEPSTHHRGMN